ncbi:DEAD/DEAH box helicase family protein [Massilia rhizosphaerae]|uniref:DEAD/DEAH box helicase family protein n=1 Tax=Massilia rhizosphaerae TaxID=2784389 RepID=UPI0018DDF17C|nr:DEAD/DEAH box helicase family protein [Massilia rhizosphaerae]
MSIDLFPYQQRAADQIANRFQKLLGDDDRPYIKANVPVPFYQALSAITGAGKTPILADAVAQMRALLPLEPVVLWISKSKVVVDQTFANFEAGGKYCKLVEEFGVCEFRELNGEKISDSETAWISLATVGSFNDKEKTGRLKVHRQEDDTDDIARWPLLAARKDHNNKKRPLILVYDEGQNLTDAQTDLLIELEPDAILVASATMATPGKLGKIIDRLVDGGWTKERLDDEGDVQCGLITTVNSAKVVDAQLIKRQIVLAGYHTEMETCLGEMLAEMKEVTKKAASNNASFKPKAIYVSKTNISQNDGSTDNHVRPFSDRSAPPILIWRYLVEQGGIDPAEIAVYCSLKFDKQFPPPVGFNHFSGGDDDFSEFTRGEFAHIIFNLSLQEGWDDPACSFAYVDKSMKSPVQIEQVIGRVLRQPDAKHFPDPDLNTANFYVRVDNKQEFPAIINSVRKKIAAEYPEVRLESYSDQRDRKRSKLEPKIVLTVPEIHIMSEASVEPIDEIIAKMHDYRNDCVNTVGKGFMHKATQTIGRNEAVVEEIVEKEHSNRVTARWVLRRAIQALHPEPVKTIDWADKRFDATIEITSAAANAQRQLAEVLVNEWLSYSDLTFEDSNRYSVGPVFIRTDDFVSFTHSAHEGYSGLNSDELEFASELDAVGLPWVRNPPNGGFSIPLLTRGDTRNFFPDFLVWKGDVVYALDPKNHLLIGTDAGRKLLDIHDEYGKKKVVVRLITKGKWDEVTMRCISDNGYSVWSLRSGVVRAVYCATIKKVIEVCLK